MNIGRWRSVATGIGRDQFRVPAGTPDPDSQQSQSWSGALPERAFLLWRFRRLRSGSATSLCPLRLRRKELSMRRHAWLSLALLITLSASLFAQPVFTGIFPPEEFA